MIKRAIFSLIMLSLYSFANELVTIYEKYGLEKTQEKMDKILESKEYWSNRLEGKDLRFGLFSKERDLLICDKSKKRMDHLKTNGDAVKTVVTVPVIIGKASGDKEKEGDLKTPVGIYELTKKIDSLDQFYGPFALTTNYPNLYDRLQGKNGSGIWIHGMPLNGKREESTRGCIALENSLLKDLEKKLDYSKTLLYIHEGEPNMASKEDIVSILATMYRWRNSWKSSDYEKYISFYDEEFKRFDGKDIEKFKSMKKRIFKNKQGQKIEIYFKDIEVVPYQTPDKKNLFRVTFFETYDSPSYKFRGNKELYFIKRDGDWKIVIEK